ncbi:hypothetical protein VTN49DRAFT_93 [Thermomyces lanuginosus]|uniref:uncharacterized protein n=1 Tax=Thermomyces lanuginosus TaxID=5541 RepID=UPI003742E110
MTTDFDLVPGELLPPGILPVNLRYMGSLGVNVFWVDVTKSVNMGPLARRYKPGDLDLEIHFKAQSPPVENWFRESSSSSVRVELLVRMQRPSGQEQYEPVEDELKEIYAIYTEYLHPMDKHFIGPWGEGACLSLFFGNFSIHGAKPNHDYIICGNLFFCKKPKKPMELPPFGVSYGATLADVRPLYMLTLKERKQT